jgi:hypothetical protein
MADNIDEEHLDNPESLLYYKTWKKNHLLFIKSNQHGVDTLSQYCPSSHILPNNA